SCAYTLFILYFAAHTHVLLSFPTRRSSDLGRILPGPVGACSDLQALLAQDAEDRLDCIALGAHLVDERADQRFRGSSSPAKKIEALRRISLSSRNRLTSAFRRLTSADSSLVTPGRGPSSTSAWASQRRTDSRETPSWPATAVVAAVRVGYSCWCSRPSRTNLARSSGSIFFSMLSILSDSNSNGIKPGPIQSHYRWAAIHCDSSSLMLVRTAALWSHTNDLSRTRRSGCSSLTHASRWGVAFADTFTMLRRTRARLELVTP